MRLGCGGLQGHSPVYTGVGYLQCRGAVGGCRGMCAYIHWGWVSTVSGGGAAGKDTLTLHTGDPIMHRGGEETWSQTTINGDTGVRNRGEGS